MRIVFFLQLSRGFVVGSLAESRAIIWLSIPSTIVLRINYLLTQLCEQVDITENCHQTLGWRAHLGSFHLVSRPRTPDGVLSMVAHSSSLFLPTSIGDPSCRQALQRPDNKRDRSSQIQVRPGTWLSSHLDVFMMPALSDEENSPESCLFRDD